jgi:SAM-dependent methyltransferase
MTCSTTSGHVDDCHPSRTPAKQKAPRHARDQDVVTSATEKRGYSTSGSDSHAGAEIGDSDVRYDPVVRLRDAVEMLAGSGVDTLGPMTWADLGCGAGTFTLALADLLAAGSAIHAMDRDGSVLRRMPPEHEGVSITTHRGDFTHHTWPFASLDGILMANSLHYVYNPTTFIRSCERSMTVPRRFLIVEYDTDESSRWVPHPVSLKKLTALFTDAGYSSISMLRSRPSVYRHAALYAALVTSSPA